MDGCVDLDPKSTDLGSLTRMVVTMSVRLAKESVMLVDRSLLLSVMLRPL